jgi:hypothetical protein
MHGGGQYSRWYSPRQKATRRAFLILIFAHSLTAIHMLTSTDPSSPFQDERGRLVPVEGAAALRISPSGRLEDAVVTAAEDGGATLLIALCRRTPSDDSVVQHPAPAETCVVVVVVFHLNPRLLPNPVRWKSASRVRGGVRHLRRLSRHPQIRGAAGGRARTRVGCGGHGRRRYPPGGVCAVP